MGQVSGGPDSLCPWKGNCVAHASSLKVILNGFLYCLGQNEAPRKDHIISLENLRILLLIAKDGIKFVNQPVENYFILDVWAEPV